MTLTLPERPIPDERLTPAQVAVILVTAADLIAREGLHRGDWWEYDRQNPVTWTPGRKLCAIGALAVAAGYRTDAEVLRQFTALYVPKGVDPDPHPAIKTVMTWLGVETVEAVFAWSDEAFHADEPERVTGTFRAIAAGLTQGGTA